MALVRSRWFLVVGMILAVGGVMVVSIPWRFNYVSASLSASSPPPIPIPIALILHELASTTALFGGIAIVVLWLVFRLSPRRRTYP